MRSPGWFPASSWRTARGSGATGRGVGVLRGVRGFVQYAQPPASTARGSWSSRPRRDRLRPWRMWGLRRRRPPWLHGTVLVLVGFGGSGGGRLTESGTALCARNLLFLQMTEVAPQSSGGKRSPRRGSTSPIWPSVTTLRSYSAVR